MGKEPQDKWCMYCKDKIEDNEAFVVFGEDFYHVECYDLIKDFWFEAEE